MLVRYDPATAGVAGLSAVGSVAGGVMQGNQAMAQGAWAQDQGIFERDYYNFQVTQEQIGLQRDKDAMQRERTATLSRSRAVMAAQGGGMDSDYLASTAGQFAAGEQNLIQDSEARQMALRTKGQRAQAAGRFAVSQAEQQANNAFVKGVTGAIPGFGTLYKEATKK
jgi:hypothetical protein